MADGQGMAYVARGLERLSLEVNHHIKNGGSFWMMINPYQNNGGSETNL